MLVTRAASEEGHTLPELLIAMVVGLIVLATALGVLDGTIRRSKEVEDRVDATQRGRLAMDILTRAVRSQVCLSPARPAVVAGSHGSELTLHVDFGDPSKATQTPPAKHSFAYDANRAMLLQTVYDGIGLAPGTTFSNQPSRAGALLTDAAPESDRALFRYFAYQGSPPRPDLPLPTPLSAADSARVARIEVAYVAFPTRGKPTARNAVHFQDEISVRAADPNDTTPMPTCA